MLIEELTLFTAYLDETRAFYVEKLGVKELYRTNTSFCCKIGATQLCFEASEEDVYYHFAFNIPSFCAMEALAWLKSEAIEIIPWNGAELVDFSNWNAEAMYFHDPSGNIVELIARKNLNLDK